MRIPWIPIRNHGIPLISVLPGYYSWKNHLILEIARNPALLVKIPDPAESLCILGGNPFGRAQLAYPRDGVKSRFRLNSEGVLSSAF